MASNAPRPSPELPIRPSLWASLTVRETDTFQDTAAWHGIVEELDVKRREGLSWAGWTTLHEDSAELWVITEWRTIAACDEYRQGDQWSRHREALQTLAAEDSTITMQRFDFIQAFWLRSTSYTSIIDCHFAPDLSAETRSKLSEVRGLLTFIGPGKGRKYYNSPGVRGWSVAADGEEKDVVLRFVDYWVSDERKSAFKAGAIIFGRGVGARLIWEDFHVELQSFGVHSIKERHVDFQEISKLTRFRNIKQNVHYTYSKKSRTSSDRIASC